MRCKRCYIEIPYSANRKYCELCRKVQKSEVMHRYYEKNKSVYAKRAIEWHKSNPDKAKEKALKYRLTHPGMSTFFKKHRRLVPASELINQLI